jgi:hypothetical protein
MASAIHPSSRRKPHLPTQYLRKELPMNRLLKKTIATFTLLITAAFAGQASADTYEHLDDLALLLERQAREVVKETRQHYRKTPEYRYMLEDAKALVQSASHLHDVARRRGSLAHLEADVNDLDATFCHIVKVFDRVEREAAFGNGCIKGGTKHVKRLLDSMQVNIRYMQADIAELRGPVCRGSRDYRSTRVYYPQREAYTPRPQPGYGHTAHNRNAYNNSRYGNSRDVGRTFSIGGGSSRVTFRF